MDNLECDRCDYITQNEDDHIVTDDGEYLCLPCNKKHEDEQQDEQQRRDEKNGLYPDKWDDAN